MHIPERLDTFSRKTVQLKFSQRCFSEQGCLFRGKIIKHFLLFRMLFLLISIDRDKVIASYQHVKMMTILTKSCQQSFIVYVIVHGAITVLSHAGGHLILSCQGFFCALPLLGIYFEDCSTVSMKPYILRAIRRGNTRTPSFDKHKMDTFALSGIFHKNYSIKPLMCPQRLKYDVF